MLSVYSEKNDCCGCGVCSLICPQKCIKMEDDCEGFAFPIIDQSKCIDCGLCKNRCVFQNGYEYATDTPLVYAVKHNDENVRKNSTSGGLMTAITDYIIGKGGVVFGVKYNEKRRVVYSYAETKADRDYFRGSKYVKADIGDSFIKIKDFLANGRTVCFIGNSCMCAALRDFIGTDENLIIVDFICHGVSSPLLLDEYIRYIEYKQRKKLIRHDFRSKITGWGHVEGNLFEDGKYDYKSYDSQLWKHMFYSNLNLNLNCHNCKYTNTRRPSDITMADFWGIENYMPDFSDNLGVSLIFVNTQAGANVFEHIKPDIKYRVSKLEHCLTNRQHQLFAPEPTSANRALFWDAYFKHGFAFTVGKYTDVTRLAFAKKRFISFAVSAAKKTGIYEILKNLYYHHLISKDKS